MNRREYSVFHLYLPSPSPFWDELREKHARKLSSIVRNIVEETLNPKNTENTKYVEISIDGELFGGLMRKIETK